MRTIRNELGNSKLIERDLNMTFMTYKINCLTAFIGLALSTAAALAQSPAIGVVGSYENHSESSFIQELTLAKDGVATYREPDPMSGKAFVAKGKWVQSAETVEVDLGRRGKYVYTVNPSLSWAEFGCKGSSYGLAAKDHPKQFRSDNLFRKESSKKIASCQR